MKIKLPCVLFALAFCVSGALCGPPVKLPGAGVKAKHLPDTVLRFLSRQFVGGEFTYRQDKAFIYAFTDEGQYLLFSREGAVLGFRFRTMQPPREVVSCIPSGIASYIREYYPGCYTDVFLPEGEGFRVELYGMQDRILHFDGGGRLLREEELRDRQRDDEMTTKRKD